MFKNPCNTGFNCLIRNDLNLSQSLKNNLSKMIYKNTSQQRQETVEPTGKLDHSNLRLNQLLFITHSIHTLLITSQSSFN